MPTSSRAISSEITQEQQARLAALREAVGSLDYPRDYLENLRAE